MLAIRGLITMQGNDRSEITQRIADEYGMLRRGLVAQFIMESRSLNEYAERWGAWPDVSFGPYQQTVKYAVDVNGHQLGDGSASAANVALVKAYFFDYEQACRVAAQQLARYYQQFRAQGMDEEHAFLEASSRYNGGPFMPLAVQEAAPHLMVPLNMNPNYENIMYGWRASEAYMIDGEESAQPEWEPIDVRDRFPFVNGEYPERDLAGVTGVVYHHGADGRRPLGEDVGQDGELAILDDYHRLHTANDGVHGWPAIAYTIGIGRGGRAYLLNAPNLITYHCGNWDGNVHNAGIVFIGDYAHDVPPEDMIDTAIRARLWLSRYLGHGLQYTGHQDWFSTECPGDWWPSQRGILEQLHEPSVPPEPTPENPAPSAPDSMADMISWRGYIQGDWAAEMDAEIAALQAMVEDIGKYTTAKKALALRDQARDKIVFGLKPRMSTLKNG